MELLKKGSSPQIVIAPETGLDADEVFGRIRCPLCAWQPSASSQWACESFGTPEPYFGGCGTVWNTFATRGKCPGCEHQWRWTSCHRCEAWSLHNDWYATGSDR